MPEKIELRLLKGTRDYSPSEQVIREKILEKLVKIFGEYGFLPLETPVLEMYEVLASKYAGGSEILKETYRLSDQGGRALGLRYDLTVPLARYIGMNPQIGRRFKRYEIGKVFRDGPTSTTRVREFVQCDVDTIGVKNMAADAEIVALTFDAFSALNIDVKMQINNRKLLSGLLQASGVPQKLISPTILAIDKLVKLGEGTVRKELDEIGLEQRVIDKIFEFFIYEGAPLDVLQIIEKSIDNDLCREGIEEMREVFNFLEQMLPQEVLEKIDLVLSLARGLEIYTGTVFEVFLEDDSSISSLAGGGRYDNIIADFLQQEERIPAVGISFGLDVLYEVLKNNSKWKQTQLIKVLIAPIRTLPEALGITQKFRSSGVSTEIFFVKKGVTKMLEYANKRNIQFVVIIGPKELSQGLVRVRDMRTGEETDCSVEEAISLVRNY